MSEPTPALQKRTLGRSLQEVRKERADRATSEIKLQQEMLIGRLKGDLFRQENSLAEKMDLAPDSTTSLRTVPQGFDPSSFVEEIHSIKMEIALAKAELIIAEATYAELFSDIPA